MIVIDHLWPVTIISDRYDGLYSGGKWLAFPTYPEVVGESDALGGDFECDEYFQKERPVGKGDTPDAALADLAAVLNRMDLNSPVGGFLLVDEKEEA